MNSPGGNEYFLASRWRRLVATIIDSILVPCLTLLLVLVTGVVEHAEDFVDRWWALHVLALAITSYLVLNGYHLWHFGQTLGKAWMGIAVVQAQTRDDGFYERLSTPFWKLVCIRALFFPLLFVGIVPYFTPIPAVDQLFIFGKKRRCIHDWISGTLVIRVNG